MPAVDSSTTLTMTITRPKIPTLVALIPSSSRSSSERIAPSRSRGSTASAAVRTRSAVNDGASPGGWWDDLPPAVKRRVTPRPPEVEARRDPPAEVPPPAYRPAVFADLTRLAGLILVVALANLLFLILALSFLAGRAPFGR